MNHCLVTTKEILDLANKFEEETVESVKGLVALWQKINKKSIEEYPNEREFYNFKVWIRNKKRNKEEKIIGSPSFKTYQYEDNNEELPTIYQSSTIEEQEKINLTFDPQTRINRVSTIARLFNIEVNDILEETKEPIKYTPAKIFDRILNSFKEYVDATDDARINSEFMIINSSKGADKYSDEQKMEAAKKKATYKVQEYKKIIDNFKSLAEEASSHLSAIKGIRVYPNYIVTKNINLDEITPDGEGAIEDERNDSLKEETVKEGWMFKNNQISSRETLSKEVRDVISWIPKLNYNGKYDRDDLGYNKYLDAEYVHATLIDKLKDMTTSDDMIPLLQELAKNNPWVLQIIKLLQNNETLFSKFYQDFRKDFINYWVQNKNVLPDGSIKITTVNVNKPEGVYYLLEEWRYNYESGTLLDDDSIYDKNGEINIENAKKGTILIGNLINEFSNHTTEERLQLLEDENIWNTIIKTLHMVGINVDPLILKNALTNVKKSDKIKYTDPITLLLPYLNIIFNRVVKGDMNSNTSEGGLVQKKDLINTFGRTYNNIAAMLATVSDDAIESSIVENGKSYYAHVNPNYIGKLMKKLKNVRGDEEGFKKFIQTEFGQYKFFYKGEKWRNSWLEDIVNNSEDERKNLDYKILLNSGKVEYDKWGDLDYTTVLLNEYWSEPERNIGATNWAWYPIPVLSNSSNAEFIRFKKYTKAYDYDENGNKITLTYKDIILNKMIDLVSQEYDRIMLVRARDVELQKEDTNLDYIANYDISRDGETGEISNIGGAEFKFLPALNSIKYEDGDSFLDKLEKYSKELDGDDLKDFIKETLRNIIDNEFEDVIKDWEKIGLFTELPNGKYKYLPFSAPKARESLIRQSLNNAKKIIGDNMWTNEMENLRTAYNKNSILINDEMASRVFPVIKNMINIKYERGNITKEVANNIIRNLEIKNAVKDNLREYFWNSKFAASQIIQLTVTDLAFYRDIDDFQKRYMQIISPTLKLNTKATYKGKRVGREFERTIYLKDDIIKSSILNDLEETLNEKIKKNEISRADKDNIIDKFKKNNVADAQAYRSLSSYRSVMIMAGRWTDTEERAYNNFEKGIWNIEDFNIIWQTIKPFVYTQVNKSSGIENYGDIKVPVSHKNSEFLLLAMYNLISGPFKKSGKLKAINEFMEKYNIDVVQFESTVKVGKQGIIDLNGVDDYKTVKEILEESIKQNGIENPNVVHEVSYEDYGIQVETPEHVIDTTQLMSAQERRILAADISPDAIIDVDGKKLTKKEWWDMYNSIITENIIQSFKQVNEIFDDPKKVEEALLEEIKGSSRYGNEMIKACTLNEDGNFNIPLYDQTQSLLVQSLLNSIIKNRITKQKIRGGSLIQVTNWGLTDELHIVFEGEGDNKRVKYFECYMPAYSRAFYEPLMKEETHELDINKLPEDLRKLIAYRTPTEDKYSIIPIYIKGFLPQMNGASIMLPAEITTITDTDFDVDKLYNMIPEFKVIRYDYKIAIEDFKKEKKIFNEIASLFKEDSLLNDFSNVPIEFKEWFENNKEKYKLDKPKFKKIKYDYNKAPKDNSLKARNNLIIDLMYGVMTNADTTIKIFNASKSAYHKKAARIIKILKSSSRANLKKELNVQDKDTIFNKLMSMDLKELDNIYKKFKKKLDPLSPRTQVLLQQRNMSGANSVGIYANHDSNHALMQYTELALNDTYGAFTFNGKKLTSLHGIKNENGEYILNVSAGYLAAALDNAKEPILGDINQNTFTADPSMLLSRLGYNPIEVSILMTQPIIMDITQAYLRESREGKLEDAIIDEVIFKYRKNAHMTEEINLDEYNENKFLIEDLADFIIMENEIENSNGTNSLSDKDRIKYYKSQVYVGMLFKKIINSSNALKELIQITRADAQKNAAGPYIADTITRIQRVQDFLDSLENPKSPLVGADIIDNSIEYNDKAPNKEKSIDRLREEILNSKLPFLQAFYTLGIKETSKLVGKYFPQYSEPFNVVIERIRQMTRSRKLDTKTINSIYNDLFVYIMSDIPFFGNETYWNSLNEEDSLTEVVTAEDKRRDFINNFPTYFENVIKNNKDIAELEFIKRFKVINANDKNPVKTLVFKNVGKLSSIIKDRFMNGWSHLLYMDNPEAHKLAFNLFRYNYYRNGFSYGPSSFIHLAPVILKKAIPGYIDKLRSLTNDNNDDYSHFIEQYIYNHLDNRKLVPEIPSDSISSFTDKTGNIKDEVTIIIDSHSNSSDRKAIKNILRKGSYTRPIFFNFIARRHDGKFIYYKLMESNDKNATYQRIEPLGYKNSFLEYEYGKNAEEINSVIMANHKNYKSKKRTNNVESNTIEVIPEEGESYIPTEDIEIDIDGFADTIEELINSESSYEPNLNYKDANNEYICDSEIIKEL